MTFVIPCSGSAGVSDLIPCKTLLESSVKPPSFLQHVMISILVNKFRVKSFIRDRHTDKDTGTGFPRQAGPDSESYSRQGRQPSLGRKEDVGSKGKNSIWNLQTDNHSFFLKNFFFDLLMFGHQTEFSVGAEACS